MSLQVIVKEVVAIPEHLQVGSKFHINFEVFGSLGQMGHGHFPIQASDIDEAYRVRRVARAYCRATHKLPPCHKPWREWGRVNS